MPRTKVLKVTDIEKDRAALDQAAALLREGKLVAIPTETVYGLAANALDPQAAHAIYTAKGRPGDNPLIVHVSDLSQIPPLVKTVPDALRRLAEAFWPGPMTVIMEKSDKIPPATSGGLETVAIRMPSHPVARELIRRSGVPLAAPSANLSGSPSPTTAQHCIDDLTGRVDVIVDGGECEVGVESTVLTLCTDPPSVLRPGAVTLEMLRQVIPEMTLDPG
ncbi:L-threonylcarbamoyladenylate synthase, partial [Anaerotruncus rubiinfantis]